MNVDTLLLEIEKRGFNNLPRTMPAKDIKILKSLCNVISGPMFITENQGRLLVKILGENKAHLVTVADVLEKSLAYPLWSSPFRPIDQTKKLFIGRTYNSDLVVYIEFANNANLRKIVNNLHKDLDGNLVAVNGRIFLTDLTEKNITLLIDTLSPHGFEISEDLKTHYDTIKSWKIEEIQSRYFTENLSDTALYRGLTSDIGPLADVDLSIIQDRSMRYQYIINTPEKPEKNLKNSIVLRTSPKVWINSSAEELADIINELKNLKRLPLLIVMESHIQPKALENLKKLDDALIKCGIADHVGIYFRLDNDPIGKEFNAIVADRKYNSPLGDDTLVACVPNGKIPKFFLKTPWKPMAVIAIGTSLRHSKTSVYANCCDLIISYNHTESLMEFRTNLCP
jgi:hypothetical protein